MKLKCLSLPVVLIVLALVFSLSFAVQREAIDVDELSQSLFPVHQQPFARQDRWTLLSGAEREAWTFAHEMIPAQSTFDDIMPIVKEASRQKLSLLVTLKIVAPPSAKLNHDKVQRYVKLMRSKGNHTDIKFRILSARPELYHSVALAAADSNVNTENQISSILESDSASAGSLDTLYLLLSAGGDASPMTRLESHPPFVAGNRVSWIVHSYQDGFEVDVAKMLVKAEDSARRLYAPAPKYFPISVSPILQIVISAYTPGKAPEALWVASFPWPSFEKSVRSMALVGQTVGFFVNPSNKACEKCENAFQSILKSDVGSLHFSLNQWKTEQKEEFQVDYDEVLETNPNSVTKIFILVVDVSQLKETTALNRLEKLGVVSVQGGSFVIVRSSRRNMLGRLQLLLIQAVAESAFGIAGPGRYISVTEEEVSNADREGIRASFILSDLALRNALASSIHNKLFELESMLRNMKRFDVDPMKVLTDNEYAGVMQRANMLLYKVKRSKWALSQEHNSGKALHLAASGYHDVKAIQTAFHLHSSKKMSFSDHFRDPRSKCHFSRIQQQAMSASELFEDQDSVLSRLGYIAIAFIVGFVLGRTVSLIRGQVKQDEKRE